MSTSQLTFIPTGWHNHVRPFQFATEALSGFGQVAASTNFTAQPLVTDVDENYEILSEKVMGDNLYTYYKHAFLGDRYTLSAKYAIFDINFMNLCTKQPNYTSPSDNLASSLTLVRSFQQSTGAYTLSEHFMGYQGSRAESVTLGIAADGKINLGVDFSVRQIRGPMASLGYATPVFVNDFSGYTAVPWTHLDAGQLSFSYNGVTYVMDNMEVNWANSLLNKAYPGSRLIDTNHCFHQDITGTFEVVVGKDLVIEGKFDSATMDILNGTQKIKDTVSTLNLNQIKLNTMAKTQVAGANEEWRLKVGFECQSTAFV
jgi:hypothetical protein